MSTCGEQFRTHAPGAHATLASVTGPVYRRSSVCPADSIVNVPSKFPLSSEPSIVPCMLPRSPFPVSYLPETDIREPASTRAISVMLNEVDSPSGRTMVPL
jgi:hypothetical protein